MKIKTISFGVLAAIVAGAGLSIQTANAQGEELIEEIITTGTRSAKPRSAGDSPVAIDVINEDDFSALGNTADLTDNLKALIPSYTATPATGDGSAFVRPTSLRGTAPDQTLVLINGKRRHRSALVQFFAPAAGNGAHGVDIGMIPGLAIKRVEVLRDGAASQYGSDAIAGVINFILKNADEGGQLKLQYGEHFEGEQSLHVGGNIGFAVGDDGFVNATIEYVDNDALSRGIQRPDAQARIDAGFSEVGQDAPFGDAPLVQTWGRPETEGVRFFVNSGFALNNSADLYARFSLAETDGRYRFFYRPFDHSSLTAHRANGYTGLQGGFTPFLDGAQDDASFVVGMKGEFDSGMLYDVSYVFGKNELDYFLNNTVNPDVALVGVCPACEIPQRGFDVGGYAQEETNVNADFSLPMSDAVNVAFGFEAREETFTAFAGEPNSFLGAGSSGFRGVEPKNAGDFKRDNVAIYADIEHDVSDQFMVQYAARYENFSDFGGTLNGKVAARYRVNDAFALRGAVSTGFHAPTPGQSNISTIITTFDGTTGLQVEEGLFPVNDPDVVAAGGTALTEETSTNISAGFTADIGDVVTLTADVYKIEVDDRIYRTGNIPVPPQPSDPPGAPARSISFYTNAIDVEHEGLDIVATSSFDLGATTTLDLALAYAYNTVDVVGQKLVSGIQPVGDDLVEDIENNYPEHRWTLTGNFIIGEQFNIMSRINFFGEHYDERGRIGAAADPSAVIDSTYYVDLEAGWQVNDNWRVVLGGSNVFDEFIDTIGPPNANRLSVGLQYPRRTVANYEGGSWYLKGMYTW
ncbi:MAG: TonB-dependent receptor [Gammaproteobacteria bacterium]|nr:TonB-dependent receptor [Gammaproteobacteria bacterium]MBU2676412.1 TonB-dependent receptor [Gammaproteobacteria bacterium]NNC58345.1 TonB-dependent receptor [Woeseiaceae bacterium]NNL50147.1 TonB-dependent receptor [Woeseiaceae bacterium]